MTTVPKTAGATPKPVSSEIDSPMTDGSTIGGPIDIVILTNGPGEVATWVKPVVRALCGKTVQSSQQFRISVLLSPCPHASGQEPSVLANYPEVDRVQSAPHFFKFLLTGKTADGWDWHPQGVVVFLGGDQFYTLLVAKRLGYRTVTYAEWDARWIGQIDRFGVMGDTLMTSLKEKAPAHHQHKFTQVGDLMADVQAIADRTEITGVLGVAPEAELIGLLPGSKPAKLGLGVPLGLAIAQRLHARNPNLHFVIGVAPNLTLADLARYTDPAQNPGVAIMQPPEATLVEPQDGKLPYFQIKDGPKLFLWQRFPALDLFSQCKLCFTTVGANTAQLGALAIPMIVLLPTHMLTALQIVDGWPRLLAGLPGVSMLDRKALKPLMFNAFQKAKKRFAWPNIWAKREVVPELFGNITPQDVYNVAQDYLDHPEKLDKIRQELRDLRGPAGAADKMADLILETVHYPKT